MRGPKKIAVAQKTIPVEALKARKGKMNDKKEKGTRKKSVPKDSDAPERPPNAYFLFMNEFRKSFKESNPGGTSAAAMGKASGEKWKSMSDSEKVPYVEKAAEKKAQYEKDMAEYRRKKCGEKPDESGESNSIVHDEADNEVSS